MPAAPQRLTIEFATEDAFRTEYTKNIARGGIFVASDEPFELRDEVELEIVFGYSEETLILGAEVVHYVPTELASSGATPGVALQLLAPGNELRAVFEPLAGPLEPTDERASQTGRRAAPRSPARVAANLSSEGRCIETRTRNLSSSGALVSVDGDAIQVGQPVRLSITHPTSGKEMEIPGTAVREVKSEQGDVTALGIEFQLSGSRRSEVSEFVDEVRAAEHSRRLGGITGPISDLGVGNLLQMFGACAPQGTLTVIRGAEEGVVAFEGGKVRTLRLGPSSGREALARMLTWRDGDFEFQARVDPDLPQGEGDSLEAVLIDATRCLDESRWIDLENLPTDSVLRVVPAIADSLGDETCKIERAILDLAAVGMTVGKIVSVVPEPDVEIYAALRGLIERGAIVFGS